MDRKGLVCNMFELKATPEQIKELFPRDFLDARIFPPEGWDGSSPLEPESPRAELERSFTEDDYWAVIQELSSNPDSLNSEGYIDMEVLSKTLRERKMGLITGSRRKEITLKRKSKG